MQATCLQRRQVSSSNRPHPAARAAAAAARSRTSRLHCNASVVWRQLEGTKAWVAHPRAARVNGVIHFLGGAFAGAAPQLLYNGFIELLADAGYTTIATPYAVTFRHDQCAKAVRKTFLDSVAELRSSGRSYLVPAKAPCFGVGHSNGALLQLLIGSLEPGATQANVIISYNNLQVSDAIPIPGFLEGLQPTVQAARSMSSTEESGGSSSSSGRATPGLPQLTAQQVLVAAAASAPVLSLEQRQLLAGAAPALEQLSSVINEVGDGLTDFRPTPEESRALIAAGYSCPATLLVQFENDNFDETPEMQQILTARINNPSSSSSSSSGDSTSPSAVQEAPAAAAAAGSASHADGDAIVDAWSSIEEDIDIDKVLQQLQQLQQQQQQQQQGWQQKQQQGWQQQQQQKPGLPGLQALLLQGSHVTPCGAQVGSRDSNSSSSELKNLASNVLGWLENARRAGVGSRGVAAAAGVAQQQVAPAAAGVAAGSTGSVQTAATVAAGAASSAGAAIQQ